MQATFDSRRLASAVASAGEVAGAKGKGEEGPFFLLDVDAGTARICAARNAIAISASVACEVVQPGRVCIEAEVFSKVIKSAPGETTVLSIVSGGDGMPSLSVVSGRSRFSLRVTDPDVFPAIPKAPTGAPTHRIRSKVLASLLDKVAFSVSKDDARMNLTGVLLEVEGGALRAVSTDGHRLSIFDVTAGAGESLPVDVMVPRDALRKITDLCSTDELVLITEMPVPGEGTSRLLFQTGSLALFVLPVDMKFPAYRLILPSTSKCKFRVNREESLEVVRRVMILAHDKARTIRFEPEDGEIVVRVLSGTGEAMDRFKVLSHDGDLFPMWFNGEYLSQALSAFGCEEVEFSLMTAESPAMLRGEDFCAVVMPVKIGSV